MEAHCAAAAARLRLAAAAAAAAGAGGLQSSQRKCDRLLWRECNDSKASLFILLARKRSWRETSTRKPLPHSLARFGCSDAPASHTAFRDHGVDYQEDSKCLSLY